MGDFIHPKLNTDVTDRKLNLTDDDKNIFFLLVLMIVAVIAIVLTARAFDRPNSGEAEYNLSIQDDMRRDDMR